MTEPRGDDDRDVSKAAAVVVTAILLALSLAGVAGTAVAIDQVAILSPDRTTVEATPGETIAVDITLQSQGGHGGEGVTNVSVVAQYHPDYLAVTDVEQGPWLEGNETEVNTRTVIANEQGTTVIEQRREPAASGTTGRGTIATLTVQVAADAPAGTTTISFSESDVALTGDYPPAVFDEPVTVSIDGGDNPLASFDHTDPDELDLELTASAANDSSGDGMAGSGGWLSIPSCIAGLALVAVSVIAGALWVSRERRG
ncbi:cellulosome anchor protein [Haloterrigena sp. H1]|uniref:cohesin domain-containing protein n=1 Tax=Haloterrigena sp. H1 TaxID=2552943 RepID=UPI00110ECE16|nr:cohesin domain-containing protein [Haloterrigena sp. H1]TMT85689.1 cellulosome anchor protein [Haloterrigena sp. H1]